MKKLLLSLIFFSSAFLFAQDYPEVSIQDFRFMEEDSLLYYGSIGLQPPQPMNGDTVIVTGVVMFPTYQGANVDSSLTISVAAPGVIIQDTANAEWGGVIARDLTNSPDFAILEPGLIIKATGIVSAYYTTTQLNIIEFDASNIIGYMDPPEPVVLSLSDFYNAAPSEPNFLAEKWENVMVEFRNVTVVDKDPAPGGPGNFSFMDAGGLLMNTYDRASRMWTGFESPDPGTTVESVAGFIETWESGTTWFMLNPVFEEDIVYGAVSPPSINNVERSSMYAGYGEEIEITAEINDLDGTADVAEAKLHYLLTGKEFTAVDMELVDAETGTYSATIPGLNDSSIVQYYISSKDEDDIESFSPSSGDGDPYWYFVLDRELKIKDVQYIPEWSNFTSLNGMEVTVTGVVSADTSDMPGGVYYDPTVFIQDGYGPWNGIILFGTEAEKVSRGDKITVTGIVNENNGQTRLGGINEGGVTITTLETGVALPEPVVLSTSVVTDPVLCESYEAVLIKFENVTVVDENEDGEPGPGGGGNANYGEAVLADDSGVEINFLLDCGGHNYHNFWDPAQEGQPVKISTGDTFESVTGLMFYSYSQYKINPRQNDDFVGHVTTDIADEISTFADNYSLTQNYPNPFNPSTKIQFSMPQAGQVNLNVYNILGQKIVNLVDEYKNAGSYSVNFDAGNLSSGIYFYEIRVNNYSDLKKMLLIK